MDEIPVVQFVKESEGRGARAKDFGEPVNLSRWAVGIAASFIAGLIIVLAVQVKELVVIVGVDYISTFLFFKSGEISVLKELYPCPSFGTRRRL